MLNNIFYILITSFLKFTDDDYKQRPATCKLKKADIADIVPIIERITKLYFYNFK